MKGFSAANKATKTLNALQKSRRLLTAADVASDISKATKANKILTNSKILGFGHRVMTP
jgi:citrate synthase